MLLYKMMRFWKWQKHDSIASRLETPKMTKKSYLLGLTLLGIGVLAAAGAYFRSPQKIPHGTACLAGSGPLTHSCGPFGPALTKACEATQNPECKRAAWKRETLINVARDLPQLSTSCLQSGEEPWIWACGPFDAQLVEICRSQLRAGDICATNRWHRELFTRAMQKAFPTPFRDTPRPILSLENRNGQWLLSLVSNTSVLGQIPISFSASVPPHSGVWWVSASESATNGLHWREGIANTKTRSQIGPVFISLVRLSTMGKEEENTTISWPLSTTQTNNQTNTQTEAQAHNNAIHIFSEVSLRTFVSWFAEPGAAPKALWVGGEKRFMPSLLEQKSLREVPAILRANM